MLAFVVAWLTIPDDLGPQLAKSEEVDLLKTVRKLSSPLKQNNNHSKSNETGLLCDANALRDFNARETIT
jgi:hypothetical protein